MASGMQQAAFKVQSQIKQNAVEAQDYLASLNDWEKDIRARDAQLRKGGGSATPTTAASSSAAAAAAAPVRTAALPASPASPASPDEQKRFNEAKDRGNAAYIKNDYHTAIENYNLCVTLCPQNPLGYLNRSQALLKVERFIEADSDATRALSLDPNNLKALYRRASARMEMGSGDAALDDINQMFTIDRNNKQAKELAAKLNTVLSTKASAAATAAATAAAAAKQKQAATAAAAAAAAAAASSDAKKAQSAKKASSDRKKILIEESDDLSLETVFISDSKSDSKSPATAAATASAASKQSAATAAAAAATASPAATAAKRIRQLEVPRSPLDFELALRNARSSGVGSGDWLSFAHTIKRVAVADWRALIGSSLDAEMFDSVIACCHDVLLPTGRDAVGITNIMAGLSRVQRFDVIASFPEEKQKTLLDALFRGLEAAASTPPPAAGTPAAVDAAALRAAGGDEALAQANAVAAAPAAGSLLPAAAIHALKVKFGVADE